jgi:uncharacterized membrane-anchored protein
MKQLLAACLLVSTAALTPVLAQGTDEFAKLPWVSGPEFGKIADQATIKLADKYMFLGADGTSRFLELTGNPPRPNHYLILPRAEGANWWAVFHFSPEGYVKDDEKLDADALLKSLKASDGPGNEERKRLGMSPLYTDGWEVPPHYDAATKRLEWGVRVRDDKGAMAVNYSSRLLGRDGVVAAILVTDPVNLAKDRVAFNAALTGFDFNGGKRYAEFRDGDKVAAYGLGALVLGGAAAAAAKTGAGKAIFKGLGVAILAGAAAAWAFLKRLFARRRESTTASGE